MTYGYTPLFTLIDSQGEPLYNRALPLFYRLLSHIFYIILWLALSTLFKPFAYLIFVHLFLLGCRLTTLLLIGGLTPILFPPLHVRLTRKLKRNPSLSLLQKHNLHNHPGLLANLAYYQHLHKQPQALTTLSLALSHEPTNPNLLQLQEAFTRS